ncbi:MAG: 1-acyl-sn-glycerol-3-phosphate acyltransferase [Chitinophagaceae bacterium]
MLYRSLKILARLALPFFCRKIIINQPALLKLKGPLLLASNHPNSFLDSVILDTLFDQPVWSLARGDVFKKPFHLKLLTALKILPVYRTSEGVENLTENYKTFDACIDLFRKKQIVTIFSEGKCINEWHLRPLKKGTARLAIRAWSENIPLQVLPVGINYSSFERFGKNVFLYFGEPLSITSVNMNEGDGLRHAAFNQQLEQQLRQFVFEIPADDKELQKQKLSVRQPVLVKFLLALPALIGFITHLPLFLPVKQFAWKRTYKTDHYDSVMVAILLFAYPLYLLLIVAILLIFTGQWWYLLLLLLLPFTAWSYIQLKRQTD